MLTPRDAEGAKIRGGGGIGEAEEARIEARRRAVDAGAGAARQEGDDRDSEEEDQGDGGAMGVVEARVGGGNEGGVCFPGLGLVVVVPGRGGGGGRGRAGGAGGETNVVHAGYQCSNFQKALIRARLGALMRWAAGHRLAGGGAARRPQKEGRRAVPGAPPCRSAEEEAAAEPGAGPGAEGMSGGCARFFQGRVPARPMMCFSVRAGWALLFLAKKRLGLT